MADQSPTRPLCAYCGEALRKGDSREHVFPKCIYPESARASAELLTVPAHKACNGRWADDEAHFRDVIALSGEETPEVAEVFKTKIARAWAKCDGKRRMRDLINIMRPVESDPTRQMIYPAESPAVLRVIGKIVIGLSCHHGLDTALAPERIWADVLKYRVPPGLLSEMKRECRIDSVVRYYYQELNEKGIHSCWIMWFFQRTPFIALVSSAVDGTFPIR